jgi:hypothetical protein
LKGIKRGRPEKDSVTEPFKKESVTGSLNDIAGETGKGISQIKTLAAIGKNLIEQWHKVLHKRDISIEQAYGLAQLEPEIQKKIYEAAMEAGVTDRLWEIVDRYS